MIPLKEWNVERNCLNSIVLNLDLTCFFHEGILPMYTKTKSLSAIF